MDEAVNYKELYLKMVRASEAAIQTLIQAQQECEELYLSKGDNGKDTKVILLPVKDKTDG